MTTQRSGSLGLSFVGASYYDGLKAALGKKSVRDHDGATVCVLASTTTELHLTNYFKASNMTFRPLAFEKLEETVQVYLVERCEAYSAEMSSLYTMRVQQARARDHVVPPEIISGDHLERVAGAVSQGDSQWFTVIRWVHFALLSAEELGVAHANFDGRLLGNELEFGTGLGLDNNFAARVIKAVGNYGEIYERNLGAESRLKIARGLNNLWNKGGLQYAPPVS